MTHFRAGLLVAVVSLSFGCRDAPKSAERPPEPVKVTPVVQRDVPIYAEWVGTTVGYVTAQIRARVAGYLLSLKYREGTLVKAGDLQDRYRYGLSSYYEVLEALQRLYPAQSLQAQFRLGRLTAYVQLYKALGGEWNLENPQVPPSTAAAKPPGACAGQKC